MIDLEDPKPGHEVGPAQREGVEPGTEQHVLRETASHGLFEGILREAASDVGLALRHGCECAQE